MQRRRPHPAAASVVFGVACVLALLPALTGLEAAPESAARSAPVVIRAAEAPSDLGTRSPSYRLGFRHGVLLRDEIRDLLATAEPALRKEALARGAGIAAALPGSGGAPTTEDPVTQFLFRAARRLQEHIDPEHLDEMRGIAAAAGVTYDRILLANTFLTLAEQTDPSALLRLPVRCTNLVALGEATSMGQLIHASTLDWGMHEVLKHRALCMVLEPENGHPFVSIGWPGMVGTLRAMGAQGIAVTEESCAAGKDTGMAGMPVNLLMRKIVEQADDLDEAVALARKTPGTCGYKISISDGRRLDARVVEVTARHHHVRRPVRGLLFGCDPEAADEAFVTPRDPVIPRNDGSSARRYPAVRALLEQAHGRLRTPLVSWALGTRSGGVLNDHTMLACVFEPQVGRFYVALGDDVPVPSADEDRLAWIRHDLLDLLSVEARAAYGLPPRVDSPGSVEATPLTLSLPGLTRYGLRFDSPLPSGRAHNDRVQAELWLPRDPLGVIIELPAWKEKNLSAHRVLAAALARRKLATLILPLPYQASRAAPGVRSGAWTLSADLARTRQALVQGLADVARVSLWLEQEHGFSPQRQAVAGVSLGGHVAAAAYGAYPERFAAGVFILAGGDVHRAFTEPNPTTGKIQRALAARGVTPEEARAFVAAIDPLTYASADRGAGVLLIAAKEDRVVPAESVRALSEAYGGAPIEWLDGGHYEAARPDQLIRLLRRMGEHCTNVFGGR